MDEFISSLPKEVITGNDVQLPDNVIRKIFRLANLGDKDIFYDIGCGEGKAVFIAAKEYNVKKAVGVEIKRSVARKARKNITGLKNASIINDDIKNVEISNGTVFLLWFYASPIINIMIKKISKKAPKNSRLISIWSPPNRILPDSIDFPFFVSRTPFRYARNLKEQIQMIYGQKCIDFTAAWMLAERYIENLELVPGEYKRFLNILYSMIIWINSWNMKVSCEDEIPPPVESYIGILKTFFNIELSDMIKHQ